MTEPVRPSTSTSPPGRAQPVVTVPLQTTAGSFIHALFRRLTRNRGGHASAILTLYVLSVAIGYLPLLIAALAGPLPVLPRPGEHRLPFLLDFTVLYALLVSFPCLVILLATDEDVLTRSLQRVQSDGAMSISAEHAAKLAADWKKRFRQLNLVGGALGVIVGVAVAYFNYWVYTRPGVGYWIADADGHLLLVGVLYLYCMFLLYGVIAMFVARNISIALLLRDIVAHSELHMIPMHPDKAGGLRPVGRMGLRNQYAITLFGVNVLLLVIVYPIFLTLKPAVIAIMASGVIAYLILGPVVFMTPLLPFRGKMHTSKTELMSEIAWRMRDELNRIRKAVPEGVISKEDEELVERLRKIGTLIEDLPVWPFDVGTLRRFLTAYIIPIIIPIGAAAYAVVSAAAPAFAQLISWH